MKPTSSQQLILDQITEKNTVPGRACGFCSARVVTSDFCTLGFMQGIDAPCRATAPYAVFRFNGEIELLTYAQFLEAYKTPCTCNTCLCCRVKDYAKANNWSPEK